VSDSLAGTPRGAGRRARAEPQRRSVGRGSRVRSDARPSCEFGFDCAALVAAHGFQTVNILD